MTIIYRVLYWGIGRREENLAVPHAGFLEFFPVRRILKERIPSRSMVRERRHEIMRWPAVIAVLLLAIPLGAGDKAEKKDQQKSGFEKGAGVPPFQVLDVTGPNASTKLCYV